MKKDIKKLKDRLASLEADWDYDKKATEEIYNKKLQAIMEEKRQQQAAAREELKKKIAEEQEKVEETAEVGSDDDEGGMFGGMMMDEEEEMSSMTQTQPISSSTQWNIIQIDAPKSYTGRYPKDFLLDYCNKQKYGKQMFNSSTVGASIWRSTVKILKNAKNMNYTTFELPSDMGASSRQDAEQIVSVCSHITRVALSDQF